MKTSLRKPTLALLSFSLVFSAHAQKVPMDADMAREFAALFDPNSRNRNASSEDLETGERPSVDTEGEATPEEESGNFFERLRARIARASERREQESNQSSRSDSTSRGVNERRVREMLSQYSVGEHYSEHEALKIGQFLGVKTLDSFKALDAYEREAALNRLLDAYTRLPLSLILKLKANRKGIDVVADNITTHPALRSIANTRPRGWAEGSTFSGIPGVGANSNHPTVIAANRLLQTDQGHGSVDLVLHEVGHSIDRYTKNRSNDVDFSNSRPYSSVHDATSFESLFGDFNANYHRQNKEESFAEMFAMYFTDSDQRQRLGEIHPVALRYFSQNFDVSH